MSTTRINSRNVAAIVNVLDRRHAFTTSGGLRGRVGTTDVGRLPSDWARTYSARQDVIVYTVTSYATPIAWYDDDAAAWIVPSESYSKTTTNHQSRVRTALARIGADVRDE